MIEGTVLDRPTDVRQPLLDDAVVVLRAPTQVWSRRDGDLGVGAIDGVYHGDRRFVRELVLTYDGHTPEWISAAPDGASRISYGGLLRELDDREPDPKVRIFRDRTVSATGVRERISISSALTDGLRTTIGLRVSPDFAPLTEVKEGAPTSPPFAVAGGSEVDEPVRIVSEDLTLTLTAPGARVTFDEPGSVDFAWTVDIAPGTNLVAELLIAVDDPNIVVCGVTRPTGWSAQAPGGDPRMARWLGRALGDLDALRLALPAYPEDEFFAAGAPWFFTLFGRDSLWAARLLLPIDHSMAASTLRVLARLQGTRADADSAEQPGKILHELREAPLDLPSGGILLPPIYYGTVDATALWVCLLADAWRAGMPEPEVRDLLPALRAALDWLLHHSDSDGDGFLDYIDTTGHGLANQGWKDSGDSIQWRDGRLAQGPIALSEVQGYAYEAALAGAELLDHFDQPGGDELRSWAAELKSGFARSFWVRTPEGHYPAVALDAHKQPVDTLTSNIGHLLGTGILDPHEENEVAALLVGPTMRSGFGIRTMSTEAAGYWPLSYHGGSVWTHDSAIIARGMALAGLPDAAGLVVNDLLAAAEGFGFRVPELHSGDPASETSVPTPYPAACRPQAWSAAAAVACLAILDGR